MTLRNLRIFLAVADCGSMSEAAKKMHIAQPSVSGTISEIEEQYQVRLFERLGRRLYITPTGEQLCEYARHILSAFDSMEQRLRNADDTDMLRIGATVTVGTCILGDVLKRYIAETGYPAPRVLVDAGHRTATAQERIGCRHRGGQHFQSGSRHAVHDE